jgi:lysozyme
MTVAQQPCDATHGLQGFDASIYMRSIKWAQVVQTDRFAFGFLECARCLTVGESFKQVWDSRPPEIMYGPYQRIFCGGSGADSAQAFIKAISATETGLRDTDLPPVLDVEPDDGVDQPNWPAAARYREQMQEWIAAIQDHFGRSPIIYTNCAFGQYLECPSDYAKLPLWLCHQEPIGLFVPSPWSRYRFWQYQEDGTPDGFSTNVDLNCFTGDKEDLNALAKASLSLRA